MLFSSQPHDNGTAGGEDAMQQDLAELAAALARDAQDQARAERTTAYERALEACGEALL